MEKIEVLSTEQYEGYQIDLVPSKNKKGFKAIVSDAAACRHFYSEIYKTQQAATAEAKEWIDKENRKLPRIL